jgi:hypothetical protein
MKLGERLFVDLLGPSMLFVGEVQIWTPSLQQNVSLHAKWFHWILSEFTGCNE